MKTFLIVAMCVLMSGCGDSPNTAIYHYACTPEQFQQVWKDTEYAMRIEAIRPNVDARPVEYWNGVFIMHYCKRK